MKKIVYLHGLESESGGPKVSFLAEKGMVYAPNMDYVTLDLQEFILTLGMPDLIIGSSIGGYVADIIGSQLGVDVLLFNPALHNRTMIREFNEDYGSQGYKRTIVLGTEVPFNAIPFLNPFFNSVKTSARPSTIIISSDSSIAGPAANFSGP